MPFLSIRLGFPWALFNAASATYAASATSTPPALGTSMPPLPLILYIARFGVSLSLDGLPLRFQFHLRLPLQLRLWLRLRLLLWASIYAVTKFQANRTERPSSQEILAYLFLFDGCHFVPEPNSETPTEQQ